MKTKNKFYRSKHNNKRRIKKCYVLIKKDTSKVKNTLLWWILQNILENQMFQRISKFIMVDSHETDFMKGIVILVKADEMEISWSLLATVYWLRDEDEIRWSKFIQESALECPYIYYTPPLLRGRLYLVRDTAAEKEFDMAM